MDVWILLGIFSFPTAMAVGITSYVYDTLKYYNTHKSMSFSRNIKILSKGMNYAARDAISEGTAFFALMVSLPLTLPLILYSTFKENKCW